MRVPFLLVLPILTACAKPAPPETAPASSSSATATAPAARAQRDTVTVRDVELERRIARLELRLMEKEAQVEELQTRLSDSHDEIVRTLAKLRGNTSRAEAASGMAEADVALQALRSAAGAQAPEVSQATRLAQQSRAEFNNDNFGGALYLANQAKALATSARGRLGGGRGAVRPGEAHFAVPIRLRIASRGNVREGPGTSFAVAFSLDAGTTVSAFSFLEDWIRITDDGGRSGWIFRSLVARP
jgi:uncharacterized coiled-coil protein SlyX